MGCSQSSDSEGGDASRNIDRQLEKERVLQSKTTTIFLAGTGESGKSTVVKQLRAKYAEPYDENERLEYRSVILSNLVQSMVALLVAMPDFGLELQDQQHLKWETEVLEIPNMVDQLPSSAVVAIGGLWRTSAVISCVQHASKFQLNDSAAYFFDNLSRITSAGFVPTDDDILRARVRTTGIVEARFNVRDRVWKVLDVGGQRSERRKWIACFENVDVLLFLFAVSEFDQVLFEDESQNRFEEAETLFSSITNSNWFKKSTLILFMNKIDLFAIKLRTVQLQDYFEEYSELNDPNQALQFIRSRILALYRGKSIVHSHFTHATDTKAITAILSAVQDQISQNRLQDAYLL